MAFGIQRLAFDPSTEKLFPGTHWSVDVYNDFRRAFGENEAIYIQVEVPQGHDVFELETLVACRELAIDLRAIDGVRQTFTLPNMPVLSLLPGRGPTLVPGLPALDLSQVTPAQLRVFRAKVLATPFVDEVVVSKDRRATLIATRLAVLDSSVIGANKIHEIVAQVEALLAGRRAKHPEWRFLATGSPLIKSRIMSAIRGDLIRFMVPLLLVALVVAWAVLRSITGTLMVVAVLLVSLDLTLGAMGLLGITLDPMTSLIPALVLVIGVADSLHLLVEQRAQAHLLGPEADAGTTLREALRHVFRPCLLTSLTTAIGFAALLSSPFRQVARFGVAAAVASLAAFLVTMLLIPAMASLLPPPGGGERRAYRLERLSELVLRRPRLSLIGGALFTIVIGLGWLRVVPNTDFLGFFPADDPVVRAAEAVQARFGGLAPCELLVRGPPGISRRPDVLRALLRLERELEQHPVVDRAFSVADTVATANALLPGGRRAIPDTPEGIAKVGDLLSRVARRELPIDQLISKPGDAHPDQEWLRVSVRARAVGSYELTGFVARVRELGARHLSPLGLQVEPTGSAVVFTQTADAIMRGQMLGFLWALGTITVVLILAFRSLKLGLLAAIPNMVPVACMLGAMGYLGIPLNSFNSMVASIAIGIAVDDTIHILSGFQRFRRERDVLAAARETIAHEGTALVSTSLVLLAGFGVLLFATFGPTVHFGLLTGIAILAALVGDLLILPALLVVAGGERPEAATSP